MAPDAPIPTRSIRRLGDGFTTSPFMDLCFAPLQPSSQLRTTPSLGGEPHMDISAFLLYWGPPAAWDSFSVRSDSTHSKDAAIPRSWIQSKTAWTLGF